MKSLTTQEIKTKWEGFSTIYIQTMDRITNSFFYTLFNMLEMYNAKSILEVGCGGGISVLYSKANIRSDATYYATDLSENMIKICNQRIKEKEITLENITIDTMDNEDLSRFDDASFEVYVANLSLQIVNNPEQMLKESFRVLQKGGRAGFSVWGRQQNSNYFTIASEILKNYGIELPESRSNFHLNDQKKLQNLIQQAGFTNLRFIYQQQPIIQSSETIVDVLLPKNALYFQDLRHDKIQQIRNSLFEEVEQIKINQQYLHFEALLVVAEKL